MDNYSDNVQSDSPTIVVKIDHSKDVSVNRSQTKTFYSESTPVGEVLVNLMPKLPKAPETINGKALKNSTPKRLKTDIFAKYLDQATIPGIKVDWLKRVKIFVNYWRNIGQFDVYKQPIILGFYLAIAIFIIGLVFKFAM